MAKKPKQAALEFDTSTSENGMRNGVLTLVLPFPPTINHYYGANGNRTFIKPEGYQFREEVANACCHIANSIGALKGRLALAVTLHCGTRRQYDIDNRLKALLDSLTKAAIWNDDSQVDEIVLKRGQPINGGKCVVEIREIEND